VRKAALRGRRAERALGQQFCDLCGKQMGTDGTDGTDGTGALNRRTRPICAACVRALVPKIQAHLAAPWWS
jgi:hypothetical protein